MTRGRETRYAVASLAVTLALFVTAGLIAAIHIRFDARSVLDAGSYAVLMLGIAAIGILIVRREPRNAVGWLFCLTPLLVSVSVGCATLAIWAEPDHADIPGAAVLGWISLWAWPVGLVGFLMLLPLLFPDGRPPAGRWRLLLRVDLVALALIAAVLMTQPGEMFNGVSNPLGVGWADSTPVVIVLAALVLILIPAGLASAVVRYRHAGRTERFQLREVVFAACATFVGFIAISLLGGNSVLYTIDYALIPAAVGLAMLRYRLYDVDVVIRRTLVYGALVACLAAIYLGGVYAIEGVVRRLSGSSSTLAVTISTLAVALVFQPLRRRIQAAVDRRFYRAAYDSSQTLDAFSARLRREIDLDALTDDVLAVVGRTLHPAHATIWLRAGGGER
jgi:hypothetical protein